MGLAWNIDPSVGIGVIVLAIIGTLSGWLYLGMKIKNEHDAIDTQIPFAKKVREAVVSSKGSRPKGLCVLMETGSYVGDVYVTYKNKENRALFTFGKGEDGQGIGEHLVPEQYVKPIMIDGLKVFFGTYTDAEQMSMDEVIDANKLYYIHEQLPDIRGIPLHMLRSLLKEPTADWYINCQNVLQAIKTERKGEKAELIGIPSSPEEFVELLVEAKDIYENAEVPSDVVLTSYESIERKKKFRIKKQSVMDIIKNKPPVIEGDVEYRYNTVHRNVRPITFISPTDASLCRDTSLTVSRLQEYGMQMEQKGKFLNKQMQDTWWEKYGKIITTLGFAAFLVLIGLVVFFSVFQGSK